ncbi:alpha-glucosidase-like [Microplitis demolitor]|uniref:alpha-glucosidase-like n=1 Tax=Microplitis demolitor TaxID=69319 RepID=UPI000440011A|nr:alpha-glucosidase-like [Microplitis demolitor]
MLLTVVCVKLIWGLVGLRESVAQNATGKDEWWRDTFIYQVYPRSFKDSNGDGVGDLNGITSKLEHLVDLGVSTVWLSPIYASPMVDFGYDISNFTAIDPIFGTIDDFKRLTTRAKALKLKVVLDFVPNHSSDKHPWFLKSVQRIKPFDEYYIWKDAKMVNGTRKPPNNWLSEFQGSAWQWNDQRKQYYYHEFTVGQPDLNYRSTALQEEMKNVFRFWLNLGVDGFRVDAINFLVEDSRFLDEPKIPNTGFQDTDPRTLRHIYTSDQNETYDIVASWRKLVDSTNGTRKIILTEAYTTLPYAMKYYQFGSNIPFNFIFLRNITSVSKPVDYKRAIDRYLNSIPAGYVANWVTGNHDNSRVASRFGPHRADQITMIAAILPGVGIIYNGDEIGMIDRPMSWNETIDPAGCNAGPSRYNLTSRDPARTPFQWDSSINAGFSTGKKTWLPVHSNYKTLNLQAEKTTQKSSYAITKRLISLKQNPVVQRGTTQVTAIYDAFLGIARRLPNQSPVVLIVNLYNHSMHYDVATFMNIPKQMTVYVANAAANLSIGAKINTSFLQLPGNASVILL